ncbi:hypothetical protein [Taibaiella koreensis]|uniref:hypothetical protein n=1 Tax=Taibaiella koreensis TaxID=1268548 RepID=UPI000E5A0E38|nr:hypothetical protein [Taibaiella koreensis]
MQQFIEVTDIRYNNGGFLINTSLIASITANGNNGLTARINFTPVGREVFGATGLELRETYNEICQQIENKR